MSALPVEINWCSLIPAEREFVLRSLLELSEQLAKRYPTLPRIELREMIDADRERVDGYLVQHIPTPAPSGGDPFDDRRLFVFCSPDHAVVEAIRQQNCLAQWGGAIQGRFAVAWETGNRFVLWHEAMHLLYAEDCYDERSGEKKTTCVEPHCLMQLEPCAVNCADSLVICKTNVDRITEYTEFNAPRDPALRP